MADAGAQSSSDASAAPAAASPSTTVSAPAPPASTSDAGAAASAPAAATTTTTASGAAADAPDVLTLRSGVELRGTAVDVRVGQTVTIRLPSGELRVIAWSEMVSASGPAFQAAAARAATAAPATGPVGTSGVGAPPAPGARAGLAAAGDEDDTPATMLSARDYRRQRPGTVPVVVESDGEPLSVSIVVPLGVTTVPATGSGLYGGSGLYTSGGLYGGGLYGGGLYGSGMYGGGLYGGGMYGGGFNGYPPSYGYGGLGGYVVRTSTQQRVCSTPCTIYLRPGAHTLHLGGEGRRESNEAIEVGPAGARVRFHSASQAGHTLGQVFMWTGGGALILGGLLALDAAGGRCMVLPGCNLTLPVALLVGGGLAIGVGIPLLVVNRTGPVTMSPATPRVRETAALRVGLSGAPLPGGALGVVGGVF